MTPKFEKHDNQLFMMLEKPEPLMPDSKFPCVVRMYHGNDRFGEYIANAYPNSSRHASNYCIGINKDNLVKFDHNSVIGAVFDTGYYHMFEIIGYPVVEGSKEWALYQIRSGKKVVKDGSVELYCGSFYKNRLFYLNCSGCLVTQNAIGLIDPYSEEEFLDLDETGWKLYEMPQLIDSGRWACLECGVKDSRKGHFHGCSRDRKPEPAYKVGDWVEIECKNGTMSWNEQCRVIAVYTDGSGYGIDCQGSHQPVTFNGEPQSLHALGFVRVVRKLSPSEVVVHIGCLRGTVAELFPGCYWAFRLIHGDGEESSISFYALDATTRKLVESLLEAMQEDE